MPSFDNGSQFFTEKQAAAPGAGAPSEIFKLCATLEATLTEFAMAQVHLDGEYWTSSPMAHVEAALRRIRDARRRCGELADELLEMAPKTPRERIAVNKVMTAYLAQVDAERMTCCPRLDVVLGSERADPEATSSETKSARVFPLSIISWKGWPKVGFLPKPRRPYR